MGRLEKYFNTWDRLSIRFLTTFPCLFVHTTWKTFFAKSSPIVVILFMVFSSLHSMVDITSIMAHCDAELEGGGDHLIGEGRDPVTD
jgi:hypothetical protein